MRGRLFEVKLDLGPGLEAVSVGPTAVVEAWNPTSPSSSAGAGPGSRGLMIRLAPPVRDQNRLTLQLQGYQRLPREGPVKLGLFAPDETTAVGASFVRRRRPRSLSVELDNDPAQAGEAAFRLQEPATDRSAPSAGGEPIVPALAVEGLGSPRTLPVRIAHHVRTLRQETVVSAEVSRGFIDLLQKTTFTVRHGNLGVLEIRVPLRYIADDWQLLDREVVDREELGRDADGSRHHRLIFDRPVLDRTTLAFRFRLPISPLLDAAGPRELAVPWISFPDAAAGPVRVDLTPTPGVVSRASDPAWARADDDGRADPGGKFAGLSYTEGSAGSGRPFTFRAQALEPVHLPALLVPRVLIRSSQGFDDAIRYRAWYWVEAHGPVFPFELPDRAKLLAVRVGGRLADRVDFESARAGYRLRLPADSATRAALVELEYQRPGAAAGSPWTAPRLPDDAVVLQTLWEARLPWDRALLGVPSGWSDDDEWAWAGHLFVRRPARGGTALSDWLLGEGAPAAAVEDLRENTLGDSHHLLFSRSGPPADMGVRLVSRAWLVAACSGVTLILGFIAIFARIRFRTAWALAAGLGLLAAAMLDPSVTAQLAQSSLMGAALTMLGLVIQGLHDRRRPPALSGRDPGSATGQPSGDSSFDRAAAVGSDDSTAIRVRTPSTMDYLPSPLAGSAEVEEARSSTLGRGVAARLQPCRSVPSLPGSASAADYDGMRGGGIPSGRSGAWPRRSPWR